MCRRSSGGERRTLRSPWPRSPLASWILVDALVLLRLRTIPAELTLGLAAHFILPIRSRAVDLSVFVITLEFVEEPAQALAEAVRVARHGVLVVALNRWSLGGFSRRWGRDTRGSLLGRARDLTLASLRALAVNAAGERLRDLRWASTLFPDGLAEIVAEIPAGDVIGVAVALGP